jgi:signal transduction histidine kinase/ActR/RegA family two-component response regulator/HAMP domain-containing protein
MTLFRDLSIKRKLAILTMASCATALLLVSAAFVGYETITFRERTLRELTTLADIIGNRSTAALTFENQEDADEDLNCLAASKAITAAGLYRGERLFAHYPKKSDVTTFPRVQEDGAFFEGDHLTLFHRISSKGEVLGTLYLRSDLREQRERLQSYAGIVALFMAGSLVLAAGIAFRLQRVVTNPVLALAKTAKAVSQDKNYSLRVEAHGKDELGQLVDGFNDMLGQIQQRDGELQKARADLEVRVQERTRELQSEVQERTRAESALQQQVTRISLLNQIAYAVAARQDFSSIVLVVLQQLEEHLAIDLGSAYLLDSQTKTIRLIARGPKSRPLADRLDMPQALALDHTPFDPCLEGEMVYLSDGVTMNSPIARKLSEHGLRSVVGSPLVVEGKVFGLLVLVRSGVDAFTTPERGFIRGLTAHVAMAVHQAQLYQDLQKAYNDLRQTQQAVMQQQRLQALGQMASGIAHDINNSLSPVIAYADLLQIKEAKLSSDSKRMLGHIKTAGEDIAHTVSRMREFYRRRDEREEFAPLELNDLAQQVAELTRPRWRDIPQSMGQAIELNTDFGQNLPSFNGNASELREALTNLILNAVDAMPAGGVLTLRTRHGGWSPGTQNTKTESHQRLILEVIDTGVGMDEQTRRRCLEPFFSTKGKLGTGLGLAMVYGIMERHEGNIEIESQPGKGTTVRLVFPVRPNAVTTGSSATSDSRTRVPLHILCIDDEPLLRGVMKEILEAEGHIVDLADNGQSGVDRFRGACSGDHPFSVVITDLGMPHLNGNQVAQIVKRESPSTPVIMLTGWGSMIIADDSAAADVDGVLSKPPRIQEIRELLNRVVTKPTRPD